MRWFGVVQGGLGWFWGGLGWFGVVWGGLRWFGADVYLHVQRAFCTIRPVLLDVQRAFCTVRSALLDVQGAFCTSRLTGPKVFQCSRRDKIRGPCPQFINRAGCFQRKSSGSQSSLEPPAAGFLDLSPKYGPNIRIECFYADWDHTSAGGVPGRRGVGGR